jgi:hypothetical protein
MNENVIHTISNIVVELNTSFKAFDRLVKDF